MHIELSERTAKLEEVQTVTHSLILKCVYQSQSILDVPHATMGSSPLLKTRNLKLKQTENMTRKQTHSLFIYKAEKIKETQEK